MKFNKLTKEINENDIVAAGTKKAEIIAQLQNANLDPAVKVKVNAAINADNLEKALKIVIASLSR